MIATGLAIAGAALGAYGAHKQAQAQKSAAQTAANAAQFNPYSINTPGGNVDWAQGQAFGRLDDQGAAQRAQLGQLFSNNMSGNTPTQQFQQFSNGVGNQGIPSLFSGALDASGNLPQGAYNQNQASLAGLQDQAGGLFGTIQNSLGSDLYGQLGQGFYGQGQQALNQAMTGSQNLFGQAQQVAGQDVNGLINGRLDLLQQQAAPGEQQQQQALEQRLFNQGRLGTTGGSRNIEAFARGLGQADLGRQMAAQDLGLQAQQQNLQTAGLFGNLGQAQLSGYGNIGQGLNSQGTQLMGLGNERTMGLLGQAPNLLALQGNLSNQGYAGAVNYSDLGNTRAQQRLQNATGLFGFGNELGAQDFNQGLSALQGQQSIDTQLRNLIALGGNIGGQQAQAGANQAQALLQQGGSPGGAFLGSLGTGLLNQAQRPYQPNYNNMMVNTGGAQMLPGGYNYGPVQNQMMPFPSWTGG